MNNEFKKSKSNNETRYVLENSATVTTGSVATAPGSLGKVQKRGNILAQEADKKKDAPKPRNFVAKNAKMGGAGKMQDKSKTIPRKEKHKKPVAESIGGLGYDAQSLITKLRRDVEEKRLQPTPQAVLAAARELAGDMEFAPQLLVKQVLGQGMAEGFNAEYDDEAGMAHSNLLTTARAVMGLLKTIKDRDNLPEWGQEKIAKAEMMLVSVWDYLQSQKEMGNDPQQGVAEGFPKDPNAPKLVRDRKTGKQYDPNKEFEKKMNSPEVMAQMKRMAQKEGVEDRTSYQVAKILTDRGVKYDPAQENELINAIGMVLVKELNMTPKQARYLISYDEDFVSDTLGELRSMEQSVSEVSPPGWEKTVKAMKKHDEIDNPFALAWSMKNKGYKSHKKESADPYFESLAGKLDQLKKK
jgi:hypothetical protein